MRTFFFSLSFCFFAAAAIVAGAALTVPSPTTSRMRATPPAPSGSDREMERMLERIAAEQAESAALVRDLRTEITSLNEEIIAREAKAALVEKEERLALEEENRLLLAELQKAFDNLQQERTETARKEGAARVAGEEASRAALDQLRQTVDGLRAEMKAERERLEVARLAAEEAAKAASSAGRPEPPAGDAAVSGTGEEADPVPAPKAQPADTGSVIAILGGGLFDSGENIVTPELERAVQKALPAIVTNPSSSIIVEGHTDSQTLSRNLARQFGDNMTLSLMRARSVADILIGAGVESRRITSVGFGGTHPIAPNRTAAGRAENRRVEIRLVPPDQMPPSGAEGQGGE